MDFNAFVRQFADLPIIDAGTFPLYDSGTGLRRQVRRWVEKGYLIPLKRSLYILDRQFRRIEPSLEFIANALAAPSYVSLSWAMGRYGLIPEEPTVVTSITTKKTKTFTNPLGRFEYRSVKKSLFAGYRMERIMDQNVFMAVPEKALVDYFYYDFSAKPEEAYYESLRLQGLDILDPKRLAEFSRLSNRRVKALIKGLLKYIQAETERYKTL
ncbi:hypothetical protein ACFL4W_03850 [Planctomycetota bacterium]